MCDSAVILRLYSCVLHEHKIKYKVSEADIRTAIQNMKEVYKPNPSSLSDSMVYFANYNDPGHRCAYLHKYASFHTALVADMLQKAMQENRKLLEYLISLSGRINICSLGGGPGTDIFGVLSILNAKFEIFQVSATVIDCMENWKDMFYDLITELRYGNYGALGKCVSEQYFDCTYLQHNLLSKMTNQVNQAISRANLVTMIKFVSASSCKDTPAMIRKIFNSMSPGAFLLYIDNAGGGFHKLLEKKAKKGIFKKVLHLNHLKYTNSAFKVKKFRYTACYESQVSLHIWRKALSNKKRKQNSFASLSYNNMPHIANIASQQSRKSEHHLHRKTRIFYNRDFVSSTSVDSSSKLDDTHDINLFQNKTTEYRTYTPSDSSEMSSKIHNKSPRKSTAYPSKILAEKYGITKNAVNPNCLDFVSKQLHTNHYTSLDITFNIETQKHERHESSKPTRKIYSKEIFKEESIQFRISKSTLNTNRSVNNQLHTKLRTSSVHASSIKNEGTLNNNQGKLLEKKTCPRKILPKESNQHGVSKSSINADCTVSLCNLLTTRRETNSDVFSDVKNVEALKYKSNGSFKFQKNEYPRNILEEEYLQYGIANNTNCMDSAYIHLLAKHSLNPAYDLTVKNINTLKLASSRSHKTITNRKKNPTLECHSISNRSSPSSWVKHIFDSISRELINSLTGEYSCEENFDLDETFQLFSFERI